MQATVLFDTARVDCDWLQDDEVAAGQLLALELHPWHSERVTAVSAPPVDITETFIWRPVAEMPVELVFAFGKPWMGVCRALLRVAERFGRARGLEKGVTVIHR
jgi:hypothetical protein